MGQRSARALGLTSSQAWGPGTAVMAAQDLCRPPPCSLPGMAPAVESCAGLLEEGPALQGPRGADPLSHQQCRQLLHLPLQPPVAAQATVWALSIRGAPVGTAGCSLALAFRAPQHRPQRPCLHGAPAAHCAVLRREPSAHSPALLLLLRGHSSKGCRNTRRGS